MRLGMMHLDIAETGLAEGGAPRSNEHQPRDGDAELNLLTPARRAALEALEREFHDLLNAPSR